MLSVIMLNVLMLSVIMLNVLTPSVIILNVLILSVIILSVIMLSDMAPNTPYLLKAKKVGFFIYFSNIFLHCP